MTKKTHSARFGAVVLAAITTLAFSIPASGDMFSGQKVYDPPTKRTVQKEKPSNPPAKKARSNAGSRKSSSRSTSNSSSSPTTSSSKGGGADAGVKTQTTGSPKP